MVLSKFVDELPIPPMLRPVWRRGGQSYYEVRMTQFRQSLHRDLPETVVWGYNGSTPGPTIEVESGESAYIHWINDLPEKHLLPIDHTVHGAHHDVPDVRTVVHVHGASVEWESDGYPEAWFTRGFQQVGPYFRKQVYHYDNFDRACTLWYHDHALGITRLNVYAGLAGFYLIRSEQERQLNLPSGEYDIPLMIQDKTLKSDGSLYYPDQPDKPVPGLKTSIVPEFFGETITVNGKVHPFLKVEPRKYRFRLLNAANARFFRLQLNSGQLMYQIATDGGLMEQPVGVRSITLSPAERAEVIIDFTNMEGRDVVMTNSAPAPFPTGDMPDGGTAVVMQFRVNRPLQHIDTSVIPATLSEVPKLLPQNAMMERFLTLDHHLDHYGREVMLLDNKHWDAAITENPRLGATEIWTVINTTPDAHPIHLHLVNFQILDRRNFDVASFQKTGIVTYTGESEPPAPQERGWKDTVIANPGQVTRIIMTFGPYSGLFVWHCHILEHEDYEMMRPFVVII
ncbi:multicopper oxidase family protein [Fictibacillus iocasae]|uniref:Multicopper oxidase family protein n=1 Tax=Fictibacillus iocasae TaxID=2715437 RepID=A0ABW2NRY9_9BACL